MGDWSLPSLTQTWANFLAAIKGRDESNAKMDYAADTNIPDGTIRWSAANRRFELWNALTLTWSALATQYQINADQVDSEHAADFASAVGGAGSRQAKDADTVDGVHLPSTIASVLTNHNKAAHDALNIDAETLDGLNSTQFLRSDTSDTMAGSLTVSGSISSSNSVLVGDGTTDMRLYIRIPNAPTAAGWSRGIELQKGGTRQFGAGLLGSGSTITYGYVGMGDNPHSNGLQILPNGTLQANGNEIWHAGNVNSAPGLNRNFSNNGYCELPFGLLIQWGRVANGVDDPTIIFPTPFPNACLCITTSIARDGTDPAIADDSLTIAVGTLTKTQVKIKNGQTDGFYWLAIGH